MVYRNSITGVLHWDFVRIPLDFSVVVVDQCLLRSVCFGTIHQFSCH